MTPKKVIEPLEIICFPMDWGGADSWAMWNKINEIIEYINNFTEAEKRLDIRLKQD